MGSVEEATERKGLGQVIKTLRELNGMSRGDLAKEAKLGADMIAKIEQGAKAPSTSSLKRIAQALGVDMVDLSQRGESWALILGTASASSAALRSIATGAHVRSIARGTRVALGLPRGSLNSAGVLPGLLVGGAVGAVAAGRIQDRRQTEMQLRMMLDERLAEASDEELDEIAAALSPSPNPSPPAE